MSKDNCYYDLVCIIILQGSLQLNAFEYQKGRQYKGVTDRSRANVFRVFKRVRRIYRQIQQINYAISWYFNTQVEGQNERLLKSFQIFSNSLLKISDTFKRLSSNTRNAVIQPFSMFIDNYRDTNRSLSKKVNQGLINLQQIRKKIDITKFNSDQSWIKSQKSRVQVQKAIQKYQKGGKNNDLIKANQNSLKLRITAEQHQKQYKDQVIKCNNAWKQMIKQFQNLCVLYQYNQQSRLSFQRITFGTALRILSQARLIQSDIDEKIKQSQDLLKGSNTKFHLIEQMKQKQKYRQLFSPQQKQTFISHNDKKQKQKNIKKQPSNDPYKMISVKQRQQIQELLNIWLNQKEHLKVRRELDKIRMQIISSTIYSFYFVKTLNSKIQKMSQYYCKLEEEHFNELLNVLTLISRSLEHGKSKDYEHLYNIINISMRIMRKKEKTKMPRQLLCSALGRNSKIFGNEEVWMNILKHIKKKSKKTKVEPPSLFKSFFKDLIKNKTQQKQDDDFSFQSVQQITTLMSNLAVSTEFSLPLIKKLLTGRQQAFELLKDVLYTKQDLQFRQKLLEPKQAIQHKLNKQLSLFHNKMTAVWCLKFVSKTGFLDEKDIELRLVCKYLRKTHKYIIYKLANIDHKWLRILGCPVRDYVQMKIQVAQNSVPSAVEQIITLDVNRSLHIHSQYLSPTMLHTLLRTFAYYNKNISYCQGMNYIAGYTFIKIRNEVQTYAVFQRMMQTHFNELFLNQFQILKIKMYQFQRILSIFLPEIADHFKRQMISSQCYIVSWIITLYAATYQYTKQSYLVDYLWNRFVVWGWKQFFKFTIWVFSLYKDELLQLSFDKALHFLGDLTKSQIFIFDSEKIKTHPKIHDIDRQIDSLKITNKLLEQLKKDYQVGKKMNLH